MGGFAESGPRHKIASLWPQSDKTNRGRGDDNGSNPDSEQQYQAATEGLERQNLPLKNPDNIQQPARAHSKSGGRRCSRLGMTC